MIKMIKERGGKALLLAVDMPGWVFQIECFTGWSDKMNIPGAILNKSM